MTQKKTRTAAKKHLLLALQGWGLALLLVATSMQRSWIPASKWSPSTLTCHLSETNFQLYPTRKKKLTCMWDPLESESDLLKNDVPFLWIHQPSTGMFAMPFTSLFHIWSTCIVLKADMPFTYVLLYFYLMFYMYYVFALLYFYTTLFPLWLLNSLLQRAHGYTCSHYLDSFPYLWLIISIIMYDSYRLWLIFYLYKPVVTILVL